jgi:plastocyanin
MAQSRIALLLIALAFAVACGSEPAAPPPSSGGDLTVDPATAGRITGHVTFTGTPPSAEPIRMDGDPACVDASAPAPMSEAVLVDAVTGGLRNVFVYVKDGLDPQYGFAVPAEPVVLDQLGCRYEPRVLGIRAGQPLEIRNSDNTFHNVHAMPAANVEFNRGQPMQGAVNTEVFTEPEVMVRFKCNVHGWMTAWVGVMAHPYFAVTGADGAFDLSNLPPGTYTVEAWHETLGTATEQVTIGDGEAAEISFTFTGS